MDTDTARMLADLGLHRRDIVSAPNADSKGRLIADDSRLQQANLQDIGARKRHCDTAVCGSGLDDPTRRIGAWNTEINFGHDTKPGDLEDRFGGQGHRAGLRARQRLSDDPWETVDALFGEERRLYLQQKGASARKYTMMASMAGKPESLPKWNSQGSTAKPWGIVKGAQRERSHHGGRSVHASNSTRERAASPRSFGTVRFGPQKHRSEASASSSRPMTQPSLTAAAAAAPAPVANSETLDKGRAVGPVQADTTAELTPFGLGSVVHDHHHRLVCHYKALWFATRSDSECHEYYAKHPDELQYLAPARDHIITETMELAKNGDQEETLRYLQTHPDRKWMVGAAQEVKTFVQSTSDADIDAYCVANPRHQRFMAAAKTMVERDQSPGHISSSTPGGAENIIFVPHAGLLTTNFFNAYGEFLGMNQLPIDAPVDMKLDITSRIDHLDLRQLIDDMGTVAQSMSKRSAAFAFAKMTGDGSWEEGREL